MFNHDQPLGLPKGSLTGIAFLATLGTVLYGAVSGRSIDLEYLGAALGMLSAYAGYRGVTGSPDGASNASRDSKAPLSEFDDVDQWAVRPKSQDQRLSRRPY